MENIDAVLHRVQKNTEEINSLRDWTEDHEQEMKEVKKDVSDLKMGQKINEHEIIKVRESINSLVNTLDKQEEKHSGRHKEFYDRFDTMKETLNTQNASLREHVNNLERTIQGWGVKIFGGICLYIVYQLINAYMQQGGK